MINLIHPFELAIAQLPVEPTDTQVLYIENHSNPTLEQYIHDNYDKIVRQFSDKGLEFIYVPELTTRMSDGEFQNVVSYYCPWLRKSDLDSLRSACHIDMADLFQTVSGLGDRPAVVDAEGNAFSLDVSRPGDYEWLFYQIADAYSPRRYDILFRKSSPSDSNSRKPIVYNRCNEVILKSVGEEELLSQDEDECCLESYSTRFKVVGTPYQEQEEYNALDSLFDHIKQKFPAWAIRQALYRMLKDQEIISRLVITYQGRVILPEYGDLEIKLTPKEKAMYFLFLRHPEGICLKDLPDYRQELLRYYGRVTRSDDKYSIIAAIDKLVDTLSGDADIQRSKIKAGINRAFTGQFCEQFARWYTIEGERAHAMRIELPQDKIVWELDV